MNYKKQAQEKIELLREKLIALSHQIHAQPELSFEEFKACHWLIEILSDAGFNVEKGACGLPTAFIASYGTGPLHVAICAEYDALPEVGHACGHNIIAASALGAGLALRSVADDIGLKISVMGTPAEEKGSGKILMLERGAFDGVHAALMIHPAPYDILKPMIIAAAPLEIYYTGKEAHASAYPEQGINAADALTVAQTALGLLRQHIRPTDRFHGIVTKGGDAPNIIPANTSARYIIRSSTLAELQEIRDKVIRCFEAGAIATGSTLEIVENEQAYAQMQHDDVIAEIYQRNAINLGRKFPSEKAMKERFSASTDMGNVSLKIPSIHPTIGIDSYPASNHQKEFAACCISKSADQAVIDGAIAMAWTVIDLASDKDLSKRLQSNKMGMN